MPETQLPVRVIRFGAFEADLRTGELRKDGVKLKFSGQPFQVLAILLERPGEVVTREELQKRLWPDTFVDVERNLNTAINKIREVLGDSAEIPRFVETLPRRGYRFIAPVEHIGVATEDKAHPITVPRPARTKTPVTLILAGSIFVLLAGAGWISYRALRSRPSSPTARRSLTRLTFDDGLQAGATWSPDGRFIAYSSDRGEKFDIWIQQIGGGVPIQITKQPGQNLQPAWSPDGKFIAYRSEQGNGGIYVIPALGGAGLERKIAPFGYFPQWSPDSSQVLFRTHFTAIGYSNRFYVARLDGSPPREVLGEWISQNKFWGTSAAWHPDGKRITVWVGTSSPTPAFWTVPLAGGPGIEVEIPPAIQRELAEASGDAKAGLQLGDYRFCWSPLGNAIYFERGYRGVRNIWKLTVDPRTLRATSIDRLTTGPGPDAGVAVSRDGRRLAFTAKSQRIQTWLFPFDPKAGQIKGDGKAVTSPGRISILPHLSPDGTTVAYTVFYGESYGPAFGDVRNEVWVKSLVDGNEIPIPIEGFSSWNSVWSPDGKQFIYNRRDLRTGEQQLMLWSSQRHEGEPLALGIQMFIYDWSPDGKWLLGATGDDVWLVPFPSSPHAETVAQKIVSNPAYQIWQPHISPDDRWIVFEAVANSPNPESALYVVPASGGSWTRITDGRHWDDKPRWSPDGRTIYFVSAPGGFFNVWGIRFDPAAGKSVGQPFQVTKFDSPRLQILGSITAVELSLAQDKLALTMTEESGNIWVLDNVDQ
jgi:Tol biopolymer transport system component/DNA-binding winged helix-turn-helix (wHTH) protein